MPEKFRALSPEEVALAVAEGAILLDLRDLDAFSAGHIPGAIFISFSPRTLPKHVAAVAPPGSRVALIGEEDRAREASSCLEASGGPPVLGWLNMEAWTSWGGSVEGLRRVSVEELHEKWSAGGPFLLVDVREPFEWNLGTIEGSLRLSLGDLLKGIQKIPRGREAFFICEQGLRSSTAASLLSSRGYSQVASVDGGFGRWFKAGYPLVE